MEGQAELLSGFLSLNCMQGDLESLKINIKSCEDLGFWYHKDELLSSVCFRGHIDMAKYLLEKKADISYRDNDPIRAAHKGKQFEMVKFLIENGAESKDVYSTFHGSFDGSYYPFHLVSFLLKIGVKLEDIIIFLKEDYLRGKYFRKWRKIVLKKFIRKVILPLYYSPGFPGGERNKKDFKMF